MPDYTYECTNENCKNQFTVNEPINNIHEANCPKCSEKAKRIYTPINSIWSCGGAFGKSEN